MRQSVLKTKQNAYAQHIQRLMVLGDFELIVGIKQIKVNEWFELANVYGVALFVNGGYLVTKPYVTS